MYASSAVKHVELFAECRHKKAMDHVLGSHGEADGASQRDMQLIDLPLPLQVLGLPHPLLPHHVDVHGIVGRAGHFKINAGAPNEHHNHQTERDDAPSHLERHGLGGRMGTLVLRTAAVFHREIKNQHEERRAEDGRDHDQVNGEMIDVLRDRKSTRLNSSHTVISYAVFCLKKKKKKKNTHDT